MRWADVALDGTWTIATEAREKGNAGELVLPDMAVEIIRAQPRMGDNPFICSGRGVGQFNAFSQSWERLMAKMPTATPRFTLHDLRRTARSLMSRAGVRPDISERVLGHVQPGISGVYDRHAYRVEKADALQRLATLIDAIVHPRENVTPLKARNTPIRSNAGACDKKLSFVHNQGLTAWTPNQVISYPV